jgi:hypothetical protein
VTRESLQTPKQMLGLHGSPLLGHEPATQPLQNVLFTGMAVQAPVAGAQAMLVHLVEPLHVTGTYSQAPLVALHESLVHGLTSSHDTGCGAQAPVVGEQVLGTQGVDGQREALRSWAKQ